MNTRPNLQSDILALCGVGPAIKTKFAQADIHNIGDLLFVLPYKYQDRTRITPVAALQYGQSAQVLVSIQSANIQYGHRRMLILHTHDNSGTLIIRFFHFSKAQTQLFKPQTQLLAYGQVVKSKGQCAMMHPEYQVLPTHEVPVLTKTLTPIYTGALDTHHRQINRWIEQALDLAEHEGIVDLPEETLQQYRLAPILTALKAIHRPAVGQHSNNILNPDSTQFRRLVLDELLARQVGMLRRKAQIQSAQAFACQIDRQKLKNLTDTLAFTLTNAQQRVICKIYQDLALNKPMLRLLQGDVGSGKTLVAFATALQGVANGLQTVIMAPTEVLAEQHYLQAQKQLTPLGVECIWLAGKIKAKLRRKRLARIADGQAHIIIGTHALFQDDVVYNRLGLVIIDEQHRFGVHQRLLLKEKAQNTGRSPHVLVMTATPIPRTLAMSHYADLDTSIIDELPPNRRPIETVLLAHSRRHELIERITHLVAKGQQIYWVCPLIETSEVLEAQAAEVLYQQLKENLPELDIALLHGRQSSKEKAQIIADFQAHRYQLMVSTTVIEVGVDIANATLMVIENAERFGLAQLHQLRGRVGRGTEKSYCVLLYQPPLSENTRKRLHVIRHSQDGFAIAQADLDIRGAGEILGTRQTGDMQLKIADLSRDQALLALAQPLAKTLIEQYPHIAAAISQRWLGSAENYLDV